VSIVLIRTPTAREEAHEELKTDALGILAIACALGLFFLADVLLGIAGLDPAGVCGGAAAGWSLSRLLRGSLRSL
jgi:hypothetical protein